MQRLDEEYDQIKIDNILFLERNSKQAQPKRKPVTVSGPCIVHMLREEEILEDWVAIKKSLLSSERRKNQRYKP